MKSLINKVVRITSDSENYKEYLDKELVIVDCYHVEGGERGVIVWLIEQIVEYFLILYMNGSLNWFNYILSVFILFPAELVAQ